MSSNHACANPACKKMTSNPKFCDRSCAASVNNRATPKRKLGGKCACGSAIPSSRQYCPACYEKKLESRYQRDHNIYNITTLSGESLSLELPRASSDPRLVYKTNVLAFTQLTLNSPLTDLLVQIMGLIASCPAYLHEEDVPRYLTLVHNFSQSVFHDRPSGAPATADVSELERLLYLWIDESLYSRNETALMASFKLDTARLVLHLAAGYCARSHDNSLWAVEGLVPQLTDYRSAVQLDNSELKKRLTARLDREVEFTLPEGYCIECSHTQKVALRGRVRLELVRCHLSQSIYDDNETYRLIGAPKKRHDITEEFEFLASMPISMDARMRGVLPGRVKIPGRLLAGLAFSPKSVRAPAEVEDSLYS